MGHAAQAQMRGIERIDRDAADPGRNGGRFCGREQLPNISAVDGPIDADTRIK